MLGNDACCWPDCRTPVAVSRYRRQPSSAVPEMTAACPYRWMGQLPSICLSYPAAGRQPCPSRCLSQCQRLEQLLRVSQHVCSECCIERTTYVGNLISNFISPNGQKEVDKLSSRRASSLYHGNSGKLCAIVASSHCVTQCHGQTARPSACAAPIYRACK